MRAAPKRCLSSKKDSSRDLAKRIARIRDLTRGFDGVNLDFEPMPEKLADDDYSRLRTGLAARRSTRSIRDDLHLSVDVVTPNLDGL